MSNEHNLMMLLGASNIGLEAIHKWADAIQPVFSAFVSLGQIGVAVVTVIYILRKIHLLKNKSPVRPARISRWTWFFSERKKAILADSVSVQAQPQPPPKDK